MSGAKMGASRVRDQLAVVDQVRELDLAVNDRLKHSGLADSFHLVLQSGLV